MTFIQVSLQSSTETVPLTFILKIRHSNKWICWKKKLIAIYRNLSQINVSYKQTWMKLDRYSAPNLNIISTISLKLCMREENWPVASLLTMAEKVKPPQSKYGSQSYNPAVNAGPAFLPTQSPVWNPTLTVPQEIPSQYPAMYPVLWMFVSVLPWLLAMRCTPSIARGLQQSRQQHILKSPMNSTFKARFKIKIWAR